ncbi:hypothetical protein Tco_0590053 [Tanacetum coccineum]
MVKIHIDLNVADLLTKSFDVSKFNFLVASIGKRGRDTKIPHSGGSPIKFGDEDVHKELGDRMEKATTTASSLFNLEAELAQTKQTYGTALTKLIKKVKKLEQTVQSTQARRRFRIVESDDEEDLEDPSKQGRSLIEELDMDAGISLVPPHAAYEGRNDDTQIYDQPT